MKYAALAVMVLGLSACGDRAQPSGSFFDPVCMPGGGVVLWEYKKADGTFDETTATKENCPWYKKP